MATNLLVIPDNCEQYLLQGRIEHGADPQIVFADPSVLHNGKPSARCDGPPTSGNPWREVDFYQFIGGQYHFLWPVTPGDHVIFKFWMKTNPSTLGGSDTRAAMFGWDLYGPSGRLWECACGFPATTNFVFTDGVGPDYVWSAYDYVPYGHSAWIQKTIDGYIPTKFFTRNDSYSSTPNPIPSQQVSSIIPWVTVRPPYPSAEAGSAWFADPELYINPTGVPSGIDFDFPVAYKQAETVGLTLTKIALARFLRQYRRFHTHLKFPRIIRL